MSSAMISATGSDRLWVPVLMIAAMLGSYALACVTPFAAFAVIAALSLSLRQGIALVAAAWVLNQAIGYGALDYPWTADSAIWGVAIGLASVAATGVAYATAEPTAGFAVPVRAAMALVPAFVAFEAVLLAFGMALGDTAAFTPAIVGEVALVNALWLAALLVLQAVVASFGRRAAPAG